jgi:hypothetical protein
MRRAPADLIRHSVNAATGELLADLVIDPRRDYGPNKAPTKH